jgi:two-component system, NtrC family, sensor kinase
MTAPPPEVETDLREENARLTRELRAAKDRQAASAEILRTVSSVSGDAKQSLDQIAKTTKRLFEASSVSIFVAEGETWGQVIHDGAGSKRIGAEVPAAQLRIGGRSLPAAVLRENRQIHVPDLDNPDPGIADWPGIPPARAAGTRVISGTPLRREGSAIGVLIVHRDRAEPFTAEELALQQSFSDQAVIAIENARLFNETREALERQIATADILKVIASSPSDVQPVFDAIATSANRLIGGFSTAVLRFVDDELHLAAFTATNPKADEALKSSFPRPLSEFPPFMLVRDGETQQFTDTEAEDVPPLLRDLARLRGYRSMLFTPLMNNDKPIGMISVTCKEPGRFAAHHIQLVRTFADQAVIAIENVRLFDEVQAKTRDLTETLQQQTATADVLEVISRSAFDLNPVFQTVAESSVKLCGSDKALIFRFDGELLRISASFNAPPHLLEWLERNPIRPGRYSVAARAGLECRTVHVADVLADPEHTYGAKNVEPFRTVLGVPMLKGNDLLGVILVYHNEVRPFTAKQVALVETFADQAVIAIENVRLFDEVQARTRDLTEALQQQTATADVLKVISRSAFDLQTVLDTLTESAARLCEADSSHIYLVDGDVARLAACSGFSKEYEELLRRTPLAPDRGTLVGRTLQEGRVIHLPDAVADKEYVFREAQRLGRFRTMLGVPMLRDGVTIGVLSVTRSEVLPFAEKQIALLQTFSDQAVIAIENVRLFDEVQARTRELSQSLDDLRTAQDRLIQTEKLASLGQLTAGIAHEIKNPLNFVNNFAALSAELTDELNGLLKSASLAQDTREGIDELTGMLKDNLAKVVQHGKRADSIVKNMLLHSREGAGEHRPADINALLEESLNLAYHGARAERPQFNVTLQRDFDEAAGSIEVFPQDITRVFLNLISNGFYAVTKRKTENSNSGFEPTVRATTRNLGHAVEIRIRDNGTGIPPEVKERMFNPFFTTKPAGEGTGLGLSMSYDIVVKQHGGRIDVDTVPGHFTEFTVVLPRTSNLASKSENQG